MPDPFSPFHFYCAIGGRFSKDHSGALNFPTGSMVMYPLSYYLDKPAYMEALEETSILMESKMSGKVAAN